MLTAPKYRISFKSGALIYFLQRLNFVQIDLTTLPESIDRILISHCPDVFFGNTIFDHKSCRFRNSHRITDSPVRGTVDHDAFGAIFPDDLYHSLIPHFGEWVNGKRRP